MDLIFEVGTAELSRMVARRIERERLVFDFLATSDGETYVFHSAEVRGLNLRVNGRTPRPWTRPAGRGRTLDPLTWIPAQEVQGRQHVAIHVVSLSALRAHQASDAPPLTRALDVVVIFDVLVRAGRHAALALEIRDIELPEFGSAEENTRARAQAVERLRSLTGDLSSAIDLSQLSSFLSTVPPILNAALAVDEVSGSATFLQIGIQLDRTPALVDDLEAARLAVAASDALRSFHAAPLSLRGSHDWCLWVGTGVLEQGASQKTTSTLSREASRVRPREAAVAQWQPATAYPPTGRIFIQVPVTVLDACGTGHPMNVNVDTSIFVRVTADNRLQLDIHFDDQVDGWDLFVCSLEIGLITGATGFVIGGAFGGPIGAVVLGVVFFLEGFFAAIIFASDYWPDLNLDESGCEHGATARDVRCVKDFSFGSDLLSGIVLTDVLSFSDGIGLSGAVNLPPAGLRPRAEAVVSAQLHWGRLSGSGTWGLIGEITVYNRGGGREYLGSIVALGEGADLWNGHFTHSSGPVMATGSTPIRLRVPRSTVEAARASGTLQPPEVLIYTSAGSRLVRFRSVPDALTDEEIQNAERLEAALGQVGGMERAGIQVGSPLPGDPQWAFAPDLISLIQLRLLDGVPHERIVLATEGGNVLASGRVRHDGFAALDVFSQASPEPLVVLRLEGNIDPKNVDVEVTKRLDATRAERSMLMAELRQAIGQATADGKKNGTVVTVGGMFDVDLRNIDVAQLEKSVVAIAKETQAWPGTVITRRTTAVASTLLSGGPTFKEVRAHQGDARSLVDVIGAGQTRTIDIRNLCIPVLASIAETSEPSSVASEAKSRSWWESSGFVQVDGRLIGPAACLPGHASDDALLMLSIVQQEEISRGGAYASGTARSQRGCAGLFAPAFLLRRRRRPPL